MRDLVEMEMDGSALRPARTGARRGRSVTVNRAESPLSWLAARGLVDRRQVEAGERLRADYETAQLGARVTMRWDGMRVDGGGGDRLDHATAHLAAKRRFDAPSQMSGAA